MDAATLALALRCNQGRANQYVNSMNQAMVQAGATTVRRAAMWCAQVGHETLSLYYQEEIASGAAYNGRTDLGNTQPGDGPRFKGRGWLQLTGRSNYGAFSAWCHNKGLVPTVDHFVRNPALVAQPPWSGLTAAWYWTVARPRLNFQADAEDILGATKSINGGTNGLADRTDRWLGALRLGDRLLPTGVAVAAAAPDEDEKELMIDNRTIAPGQGSIRLIVPTGNASSITARSWVSATVNGGDAGSLHGWFQSDTGGISDFSWTVGFRDGRSDRPWAEIPSGTTQININYSLPQGGTICLEAVGK